MRYLTHISEISPICQICHKYLPISVDYQRSHWFICKMSYAYLSISGHIQRYLTKYKIYVTLICAISKRSHQYQRGIIYIWPYMTLITQSWYLCVADLKHICLYWAYVKENIRPESGWYLWDLISKKSYPYMPIYGRYEWDLAHIKYSWR